MNTIFMRHGCLGLVSLAVLITPGINSSAVAKTPENTSNGKVSQPVETIDPVNGIDIKVENHNQNIFTLTSEQSSVLTTQEAQTSNITTLQPLSATITPHSTNKVVTPIPGTVPRSSTAFNSQDSQPTTQSSTTEIAQTDILPGRATRGGRSYIGIGANIGITGNETALGDGNFAVLSKIGLTKSISVRPSAVIGDRTVILVPLSYDFSIKNAADPFTEVLPFAPYIGAGAAFKTGDDSEVGFLLSGGIDFPLGSQFTATAAVNAGFFDDTDVGLLLGVGFNFPGF